MHSASAMGQFQRKPWSLDSKYFLGSIFTDFDPNFYIFQIYAPTANQSVCSLHETWQ